MPLAWCQTHSPGKNCPFSKLGHYQLPANLTREGGVLKLGLVGVRSKEDTPSDLIASREWEAALFFDSMKYRNKETKNLGSQERKVGKSGKGGGKMVKLGRNAKSGLCSITRIYTHLHAFTQSSWPLTLWGSNGTKITTEARRHRETGGRGRIRTKVVRRREKAVVSFW